MRIALFDYIVTSENAIGKCNLADPHGALRRAGIHGFFDPV